jgi:hypothetical protein
VEGIANTPLKPKNEQLTLKPEDAETPRNY